MVFDGISTNNLGTADLVVNLSPYALGSNGLLVVKSAAGSGHSLAAGTTLVASSFFTQSGGLNNGTLSFYLFFSSSAFSSGADYDANNDGVLDNLPSGSQVLDDVALLDNNSSARATRPTARRSSANTIARARPTRPRVLAAITRPRRRQPGTAANWSIPAMSQRRSTTIRLARAPTNRPTHASLPATPTCRPISRRC